MTLPRPVVADSMVFLTRRCTQQQFLLRPDAETNQAFLYCLGVAAQRCDIGLVCALAMSDHYHAALWDRCGLAPRFMGLFHGFMGRAGNAARRRRENFWSAGDAHYCRLGDAGAALEKSVYTLANPVKDHLVEKSIHWPGANTFGWLDGREVVVKRPRYFDREGDMPESVTLKLVAPPTFEGTFEEWAALLRAHVEEAEQKAAAERAATGRRIVGRKAVRAASPSRRAYADPAKRKQKPLVAAQCAELRASMRAELKQFRLRHRFARLMFKLGWREVPFLPWTWRMVQLCAVTVADT
ncbi:MAG: hypothetical protein U0414_02330 [Polyangiaceae bacterium]